jgi:CBS domain containing-hemolysin-like protein
VRSALAPLTAALLLVIAAGLAAAAEVSTSTISRVHAAELVRTRRRHADRLARISEDPARYLNTATLVRVVCEITATVLVVLAFSRALPGALALVLAALAMTAVSFVLVGVAPRILARRHPENIALAIARPLTVVTSLLGPVPTALIALGSLAVGGRGGAEGPFATEARLREMVDLAEQHSAIESDERAMIQRVFDLGDTLVREVMVPRPDIVSIEEGRTLREAEVLLLRSGFSRVPVTGTGGTDDIVGLVYLKDLARRLLDDPAAVTAPVESALRPPVWVPDSKPAADLLRDMQRQRVHIAVVVDEYGGTAGLVTIEDIVEEIVGEITDEYDVEVAGPELLPDGSLRVNSRLSLDDLGELLGRELDDEDVDTVGGLLAKGLGRVPILDDRTEIAGLSLSAESGAGRRNRIGSVRVRRLDVPDPDAASGPEDPNADDRDDRDGHDRDGHDRDGHDRDGHDRDGLGPPAAPEAATTQSVRG